MSCGASKCNASVPGHLKLKQQCFLSQPFPEFKPWEYQSEHNGLFKLAVALVFVILIWML